MKTKTIKKEFWVSDTISESIKSDNVVDYYGLRASPTPSYKNKITISWEEPEKTVSISESEFDRIVSWLSRNHSKPFSIQDFKEKVFVGEV